MQSYETGFVTLTCIRFQNVVLVVTIYIAWCRHRSSIGYIEHGTCDVSRVGLERMQEAYDVRERVSQKEELTSKYNV